MKNQTKISIITVCLNAETTIGMTIDSVQNQSYKNIEYIIVDGASTDSTMEIVTQKKNSTLLIASSEQDTGIYDAMNKGVHKASGDYILFLNAGDILYDSYIVEKVVNVINSTGEQKGIYYGNIIYAFPDGSNKKRVYNKMCGKRIYNVTGDCINHQAIFSHKECFKLFQFDLRYKICGDRDWIMRVQKMGIPFICMMLDICIYSLDEKSASIANKELYNNEARVCLKHNMPYGYPIFCIFEWIRKNRFLSKILHGIYKILYIRKEKMV